MNELLDYLSSYRGIESLVIRGIMKDCHYQEDDAGLRFWDQIVPLHKSSLTELYIQSCYEGSWNFGPSTDEAIEQCSSMGSIIGETYGQLCL